MVRLAGSLFNDAGAALASASVAIFPTSVSADESTGTGSATATTTTNSSGVWSSTGLAANSYDVRITSGSSIRWRRFADEIQLTRASFGDDAGIDLGLCSDQVIFNRSTSLSADATLSGVIESGGAVDHLGVAANSLIVSNVTNDGDIMFLVSDGGNSKGLLKLCGANGRVIVHGGDLLMSGAQKIYFNDIGGEYMSSDGCTLTITGATALTPTIGSTAWANANHTHAGSSTGGTVTATTVTGATQACITTLTALTTIGAAGATTNVVAGDVTMYNAVNNGNPTISLGSTSAERLVITANYDSGAQTLCNVEFATAAASSTANKGKFVFDVDGTDIMTIDDGGIDIASGKTFSINGSDLCTSDTTYSAGTLLDLSGTTFNVDLTEACAATIANGDYIVFLDGGTTGTQSKGDIHDVANLFAGTGLCASSSVINIAAAQTGITSLLATDIKIGEDDQTKVDFADANIINLHANNIKALSVHNTSSKGELRFYEGANYVGFAAPCLGGDQIWTLPTAKAGSACQVLTCDGCGVLSWASAGGARSVAGTTDNGIVTFVNSGSTFTAEAGLTFDGTTLTHQTTGATVSILSRYSADATAPDLRLLKSRGTSLGATNAIQSGDSLGKISWYGADGDSLESGGYIEVKSGATWSNSNRQTYMDTYVTPSGCSTTNTLTTRLTSDGQLRLKDGSASAPAVSFLCDTDTGFYHTTDVIHVGTGGTSRMTIDGAGVFLGDTANGKQSFGLTINQSTLDNAILSFKSSTDVVHGVTCLAETDTYAYFQKNNAPNGGLDIVAINDTGSIAFGVIGIATSNNNCKGGAGNGPVVLKASLTCGSTTKSHAANDNLVAIKDHHSGSSKFIFDMDGDLHVDGSSSLTVFDDYCDVELLTAAKAVHYPECHDFRKRFSGFIDDYAQVLHDNKVVTMNDDGHHFISYKGMMGLTIDSIRQLHGRIETLETQLTALQGGK